MKSGLPTMLPRRSAKRTNTHSETAHKKGCRCASCKLKFADFEVEAHLPRSGVDSCLPP